MTKFVRDFVRDESGAAAAEYVMILAIIGAGVGAGAIYLGGKVKTALTMRGDQLVTCASTSSAC